VINARMTFNVHQVIASYRKSVDAEKHAVADAWVASLFRDSSAST